MHTRRTPAAVTLADSTLRLLMAHPDLMAEVETTALAGGIPGLIRVLDAHALAWLPDPPPAWSGRPPVSGPVAPLHRPDAYVQRSR